MRKEDIIFRGRYASVNIKVPYKPLDEAIQTMVDEQEVPAEMTEEWIREHLSEETIDSYFWAACESEFEYFTEWAGSADDAILPGTTFEQDGRSGGWAVSNWTADAVEGWDAVTVAKWGKIVRVAREIAAGVNEQMIMLIYLNEYEPRLVRARKRGRALHKATFA